MAKLKTFRRVGLLGRRERLTGPLVFLPTHDSGNYYHFLVDVLTRLYAFSDDGAADLARLRERTAGIEFVLDASEPRFQRELLDLLGLRHRSVALPRATNWIVEPLLFPTYVGTPHPQGSPTLFPPRVLRWLRAILREAAGARADAPRRRLYVSRRGAPTRRIVNEPELEEALARRGFEIVRPEELSAREQIVRFAAAEAIVAPHGAGLANILHAERATVVELVSPAHQVVCFYLLGSALEHDYWYVVGELERAAAPGDFTPDYRVDADRLLATLDAAGVGEPQASTAAR